VVRRVRFDYFLKPIVVEGHEAIAEHRSTQTGVAEGQALFSVVATGTPPLGYQAANDRYSDNGSLCIAPPSTDR
jgi:hypothetical protein